MKIMMFEPPQYDVLVLLDVLLNLPFTVVYKASAAIVSRSTCTSLCRSISVDSRHTNSVGPTRKAKKDETQCNKA